MLFGPWRTWLSLEPDTGLDHCPRILLSCFRARISASCATPSLIFKFPSTAVNLTGARRRRRSYGGSGFNFSGSGHLGGLEGIIQHFAALLMSVRDLNERLQEDEE